MLKQLLSISLILLASFSLSAQTQFQNAGFEDWEEVGLGPDLKEPVNWSSIKTNDDDNLNAGAPVVWEMSDDAHSGNHSVKLHNVSIFSFVATGTITNGRVHSSYVIEDAYVYTNADDSRWNTSFTGRPDSVVGWYKANMQPGDNPAVRIVLHTGYQQLPGEQTNIVAEAMLNLPSESVTEWTRFSAPFVYEKDINPEYLLAILYSGNGITAVGDSEAWFDDMVMIYPTGIDEISEADFNVFHANGELNVMLAEKHPQMYQLKVFNVVGHELMNRQIESGSNIHIPLSLPTGMYIVSIVDSGKAISKKIFIQ